VLRLTGLFDRPATPGLLTVLRRRPAIRGLTEDLVGLDEDGWRLLLRGLERARLIRLVTDAEGAPGLDAHPLIREYFAEQLRRHQPAAFTAAHGRLFEHLCAGTPYRPDDLEGLQPLYQAVRHGCLAGRQQEALEKVYDDRILRGTGDDGFYSTRKLGAIGADLGAVAAFFDAPWGRVSPHLTEPARAWLLNSAAFYLRALGRLTEALEPMRDSGKIAVQTEQWKSAAIRYSNLSELEVTLGRLPDALADARTAVAHADRSGDAFLRMGTRTTAADALHQSGARAEAGRLFAEAERMQREDQPHYQLLYSLWGFRYGDWRLAPAERAAWRVLLNGGTGFQPVAGTADLQHTAEPLAPAGPSRPGTTTAADPDAPAPPAPLADCAEAERRAAKMFEWRVPSDSLLDIALDHLTQARARLLRALLTSPRPPAGLPADALDAAVTGLRRAGAMEFLARGLLTAAWHQALTGDPDEAMPIAERGPMPLFEADVRLYRVRLWWAGLLGLGAAASRRPSGPATAPPDRGQEAPAPTAYP
jgi:tetratricopeptide (TPR) repeat protein